MEVVVGRLGRAHGIHGEVSVEVRTDEPDLRFAAGAVLRLASPRPLQLTVASTRTHQDRLLVRFAELGDRTAAESLRGVELLAEVDAHAGPADPDEFYDRQLVGLAARTTDDLLVGTVVEVQHLPGQDLLVVRAADREHLIPFVTALVPSVDLAAGIVRVEAVPGLLDDAALADDTGPGGGA